MPLDGEVESEHAAVAAIAAAATMPKVRRILVFSPKTIICPR